MPTDWRRPTTGVLARISYPRAMQFWDPHHLVSQELLRSFAQNGISFEGHRSGGHLWDFAALYAPAPAFNNALPAPAFFGGPVVDITPELENRLENLSTSNSEESAQRAPAWGLINSSR